VVKQLIWILVSQKDGQQRVTDDQGVWERLTYYSMLVSRKTFTIE